MNKRCLTERASLLDADGGLLCVVDAIMLDGFAWASCYMNDPVDAADLSEKVRGIMRPNRRLLLVTSAIWEGQGLRRHLRARLVWPVTLT